jgi:RhtB (resistance to homoserine/threonine) family protein
MYLEVFAVGLLGALSPGPDFVVVMKNSLGLGRKFGIATALGIAAALIVHVSYTILGFTVILEQSPVLFNIIRIAGAAYLLWLGWNGIRSRARSLHSFDAENNPHSNPFLLKGFREGFLCNLLNPKSALFFLSIFSQFIGAGTPNWVRWIYGGEIILAVGLWFILLAILISKPYFRSVYQRYMHWFDRCLGAALIVIASAIVISAIM